MRSARRDCDCFASRLPPEICDHVIDCLSDDPASLCACKLTCKSWIPRTRTHLFRVVLLDQKTTARFKSLLGETAEIGPCVCALTVDLGVLVDTEFSILQSLPSIRKITLKNWRHTDNVNVTLAAALVNVTTLELDNADLKLRDLPHMLAACMSLRCLSLKVVNWRPRTGPDAAIERASDFPAEVMQIVPSTLLNIECLSVKNCSGLVVDWLTTGPLDVRPCRLSLSWDMLSKMSSLSTTRPVQHLLDNAGDALHYLMISSHGTGVSAEGTAHLPEVTALRNTQLAVLHIDHMRLTETRRPYRPGHGWNQLSWTCKALGYMCLRRFRCLQLELMVQTTAEASEDSWAWHEFDRRLARAALRHRGLELILNFHLLPCTPGLSDGERYMRSCLAASHAAGVQVAYNFYHDYGQRDACHQA